MNLCACICILALSGISFGQTYPSALRQTNAQLTTIPLPSPIPTIGGLVGANSAIVAQPYGTTIVRCTDVNTDPTNLRSHSFDVTDTGGDNVIQWNSNQRLLRIVRTASGSTGVVGFDPVAQACTTMNPASVVPTGAQWSLTDPNADFYLGSNNVSVFKRIWDFTKPLASPMTYLLFKFTAVCPMMAGMNISYTTQIVTQDDDLFSMAFGTGTEGQDTAQYVVSYQISTDRCWLLNTLTGDVQRSSCTGSVDLGTVSTFFPFTIHSMDESPSGILQVGIGVCATCPTPHGPFFYYPRSTHMDLETTRPLGGHATLGNKVVVDATAAPELASRPYIGFTPVKFISSNSGVKWPTPTSTHYSWANDDPNDTFPICGSSSSTNRPQPLVIQSPLQQEIFCIDPTTGTFVRLAPTFTSGIENPQNFRSEFAILSNGKQGYIAFASDWEGTLGNDDGVTATCALGAGPPTECRNDVFIVVPH